MEENYRLGIDFGTTYSCVGVWKDGGIEIIPNEIGERTTPSVVIFDSPDKVYIGEETLNHISKKNSVKVYEIKRLIGKKYSEIEDILKYFSFKVIEDENEDKPLINITYDNNEERNYSPELIASLIFKKLINNAQLYLKKIIKEIIITVPADFTNFQRNSVKFAAESIQGIKVINIINEPSAAVLSYGFPKKFIKNMLFPINNNYTLLKDSFNINNITHPMEEEIFNNDENIMQNDNFLNFSLKTSFLNQNDKDKKIIVFDFGGGTFDVSLIEITDTIFETRASAGNQRLGGGNFDNKLMDCCLEDFSKHYKISIEDIQNNYRCKERLKIACEQTKKFLSIKYSDTIYIEDFYDKKTLKYTINRASFEKICEDLFEQLIDPLDRVLTDSGLDSREINEIILVGGSSKIPKIKEILKDKFPESNINESINPDEVVAYGAVIYSESLKRNSGDFWENFDYLDSTQHSYGVEIEDGTMEVIIPRGSHYPINEHKYFTNAYDDQYTFVIRVFEGENLYADDNDLLAEFTLLDIPKKRKGELVLEVIFTIDTDQILNVTGYVSEGNIKQSIKIDKKYPLSNDPNSKLILGNISINGDDFSKEEKRLKLEIFNYSKNFKKMKNDNDKYNLIKNYNNVVNLYLSFLEEKYNDIKSEKYLFLVEKLFKSYSYFYKTQLIAMVDINEKINIKNTIEKYLEKISQNNPFRLRQLLIHFQDIKKDNSDIYYTSSVYSMELLQKKGDEHFNNKERISLQIAKNLYEECLSIGKIFEKDNILVILNDEISRTYNSVKDICETQIKIISVDSQAQIENTKKTGQLFNNEKNFDDDTLCLLSYNLNQSLNKLNEIDDLNENIDAYEAKSICLANIVKIELLKKSSNIDIKKLLELCEESIKIADELGEDCTNKEWYKEIKRLQEEFQKKSISAPPPPNQDLINMEQEFKNICDLGPDEFVKFLLTKYPIEACELSDEIIEEYNKNKRNFFKQLRLKYNKANSFKPVNGVIDNNNFEEKKKIIIQSIHNCMNKIK